MPQLTALCWLSGAGIRSATQEQLQGAGLCRALPKDYYIVGTVILLCAFLPKPHLYNVHWELFIWVSEEFCREIPFYRLGWKKNPPNNKKNDREHEGDGN